MIVGLFECDICNFLFPGVVYVYLHYPEKEEKELADLAPPPFSGHLIVSRLFHLRQTSNADFGRDKGARLDPDWALGEGGKLPGALVVEVNQS